jgi:Ca-activated chloride channel homolog
VSFASPAFLVGLTLIPLLLWLYVRSERRPHAFAPAELMPSVVRKRAGWRRHAALVGYGTAVAALLVALAKPQATVAVPTEQARVMIVTDRSGSMLAKDVTPNRLAAAKRAAGAFLDAVPERVRVGAVAFNHKADVLQSPTRDHEAVREAIQSITAAGSTATGDAIKAALASLKGDAPAAIVLLSDGKSVRGSDPLAAAQRAKQLGIPVSTVALGTADGTVLGPMGEPLAVPPDPATLQEISRITGGTSTQAADAGQLDDVYKQLGSKVGTKRVKREVSSSFAAAGLVLLPGGLATGLRWRGRLP